MGPGLGRRVRRTRYIDGDVLTLARNLLGLAWPRNQRERDGWEKGKIREDVRNFGKNNECQTRTGCDVTETYLVSGVRMFGQLESLEGEIGGGGVSGTEGVDHTHLSHIFVTLTGN